MAQCTKDQLQTIYIVGMRCIRLVALHVCSLYPCRPHYHTERSRMAIAEAV